MRQQSLASQGSFEKYGRKSRRALFLDEMNQVVPWAELEALVEPRYPKAGSGRRPVGLAIMLRVYFVQQWFNLSDPGVEEALYESAVLRCFVGVDLGVAPAPDETQGHSYRDRHDRRCDDYPRAFVDQEPERQTRPGDASDPQGPTVVCVTNTSESS
jgi:IS5 family transposase